MGLILYILIDGVTYGLLLFMIAVGLSITMGLMRFINLAHGVFALIGCYAAISLVVLTGLHWAFATGFAVIGVAVFAALLERVLISRVYHRTELDQVLLTIGLVFVAVAVAGLIFGTRVLAMPYPAIFTGSLDLGFRSIPAQRVLLVCTGIASFIGLWLLIEKTRFGIQLRAVVDHRQTADALGINGRRIATLAFALGAGMAALGGIVGAALLPVEPFYPLTYIVLFLAVVAVGGLGSLTGTLASAMTLGMIETATRYLAPGYASIVFFIAIILIISWKPHGLFGRSA